MPDYRYYLTMFEKDNPEIRLDTLDTIEKSEELSDDESRSLYFLALGDIDWRVRKKAVTIITQNPCQKDIKQLISALGNETNAGKRNSAQEALTIIGEDILPYLYKELKNEDEDVRKFIVDILGAIRSRDSVKHLIEMLRDSNPNIQLAAVEALGVIGDRSVIDSFIELLRSTDNDWLRFGIIEAIGNLKDNAIFEKIEDFLKIPILVKSIMNLYSKLGEPVHIGHIMKIIKKDKKRHIKSCVQALIGIKERSEKQNKKDEFIGKLSSYNGEISMILRDYIENIENNQYKKDAILILGYLSSYEDLKFILQYIEDMDLHEIIIEVLKHNISKLTEYDYINLISIEDYHVKRNILDFAPYFKHSTLLKEKILELLTHPYGYIRGTSVSVLRYMVDNKNDVIKIIPLLNDRYADVQEFAIETIIDIISNKPDIKEFAIMLVKQISSSPDEGFRGNAAKILKYFTSKDNIEILKLLIKDEVMEVRREAIKSLLYIAEKEKLDFNRYFELGITDEDRQIRIFAAKGFIYGNKEESIRILESSLSEDDPIVRAYIFRSLFIIGDTEIHKTLKEKLNTENPYVIITLLEDISDKEENIFLDTVLQLTRHADNEVKKSALYAYYVLKGEESLLTIKKTLSNAPWDLKASIIEILSNIETLESLMIIANIANDEREDIQIRKLATAYIIESGDEDTILNILPLIMDTSFYTDIVEGLKSLKSIKKETFDSILASISNKEIKKTIEKI